MDESAVRDQYVRRYPLLLELADTLQANTLDALAGVPHIDRVAFRAKSVDSFVAKSLDSKYKQPLSEIEDQIAGRVITFFRDDIETVRAALNSWFGAVERETKEPSTPNEFGYESEHFVVVIQEHIKPTGWNDHPDMPNTFELQVRTLFMHAWAEPQHDLGYKGSDIDRQTKRELAWIAASAWGADKTLNELAARLAKS
ncbi:RelA/SpoT domain-containing protein [Mycobacterium sp. 29Ha]|uniref:GTP pyrophosphokinase n=1 Tax=Mycobacterium sp. 29Ha TaxID=2939268 RepID=UPI0029392434|nr:RelA/SpoT domain-containing protein [Mycobacterium sp. 29Ha]MDV3135199.1 RelA/SpoT domain-containing protein [Mycobacterium sp. 29Ha]